MEQGGEKFSHPENLLDERLEADGVDSPQRVSGSRARVDCKARICGRSGLRDVGREKSTGVLFGLLRGHRCRVYNSDTKVRIQLPSHSRFYYPDVQVVCKSNPESDVFQDCPSVLVEVLSTSTRRVDTGEKREGYLTIPALGLYLMFEQEQPIVVAYRRTEEGFVREIFQGLEAVIAIPELKIELALADAYERVEFGPEDVEKAD